MMVSISAFVELLIDFISNIFGQLNTVGLSLTINGFTYYLGVGYILLALILISMVVTVLWKGAKG